MDSENFDEDEEGQDDIPSSFRMRLMEAQVADSLNANSESFDTSIEKVFYSSKDEMHQH